MAQHDYNIANQTGANFRADLNNALSAIATNNSGTSEPSTTFAYEWWIDTSSNVLKLRNSSNNAWVTMPFSITADNTVDINAGTVNGITSLSFSSGSTVASILDEDNLSSDSATALATQQSIKAYVDSQVTAQDLDITDGSSTIDIDLDSETLSLLGGTGVTSTASGSGVTFAIGQPVATSDNVVFNQVTGALVGNASTATTLQNARTISGVSFDGSANITLDTDDIGEGSTNLYYTNARFDTRLATKTTNNLTEGTNLYYTNERVDDQVNSLLTAGTGISLSYNDGANTLTITNTNSADITSVVAGDGLTGGGTSGDVTLAVGVDDSSIEINSDALRVKASGITNAMLGGSIANAKLSNSSVTINSQAISLGGSHTFNTDAIGEGSSNLYFTNERTDDRVANLIQDGTGISFTYDDTAGTLTPLITLAPFDTDNLSEGSSNLYYTNARANSAIDARVTNTFINNLSGVVADTSTALATARTIAVAGDVVGSASFDGTADISISTTIQANSVALGTDTTGNYIQTITGTANKVSVSGSGSESADVTLTLPSDVQIANDLTVAGDLTVNGDLTYLDTTNLKIEDNLFELNANLTGSPVNDSGMLINRGNQNNAIFIWDESADKFTLGLTTADGTATGNITLASLGTLVGNLEGAVTGTVSSISNHSTSDLSEGTNLYFTNARARSAISASGDISYNSSTGVISFTQSTAPVTSVNSATGAVVLDTDDVAEGSSNLYFTNARARSSISESSTQLAYNSSTGVLTYTQGDTDTVGEGSSNLYFTNERVDDRVSTFIQNGTGISWSYNDGSNTFTPTISLSSFDTDNLSEGSSNLYYTDARANSAIDARVTNTFINNLSGVVADTTTALANARTIGGVSFDGTANIDLAGVNSTGNQDTSGNAATATILATARTIGGTSFDGSANIAVALASTATTLASARTINGVSFDGSANITTLTAGTGVAVSGTEVSIGQAVASSDSPTFTNLTLNGTDSIKVPAGTTGQRNGSPAAGMLRYNSTTGEFEGYTNAWGAIGGGSGSFSTNIFAGDGSDTTFTLSATPSNENNLLVFVDGVFQAHDVYSVSGTTLTFATAPANGRVITVYNAEEVSIGTPSDNSVSTVKIADDAVTSAKIADDAVGNDQLASGLTLGGNTTATLATAAQPNITSVGTLTSFRSTGIDDNADALAITIDSSENTTFSGNINLDLATPTVIFKESGAAKFFIGESSAVGGGSGYYDFYGASGIGQRFFTAAAERMRIDSSGRILIGTTSSSGSSVRLEAHDATNPIIQVKDTTSNIICGIQAGNAEAVIRCPQDSPLVFNVGASETERMRITTSGTMGFGMSPLGTNNGSAFFDGNVSSKDGFMTTASDLQMIAPSAGNTIFVRDNGNESMRILSNGVILIGTSTQSGISNTTTNHGVSISGGGQYVCNVDNDTNFLVNRSNGNGNHFQFRSDGGNTGNISTNGSAVSYNAGSDYRLKQNVIPLKDGLDRVNKLNPVQFDWKKSQETDEGFIAHEAQEIVPYVVKGEKDGEEIQTMDYAKLTPLLVKAIQEQQEQIETLKARIDQMENK